MNKIDAPALQSRTIEWDQPNLLNFLRRASGEPRFFWESDRSDTAFAGFGAACIVTAAGARRFDSIRAQLRACGAPGSVWLGGFSFSSASVPAASPVWRAFPQACFILPKYLLSRRGGITRLTITAASADPYALDEALWNLPAPQALASPNGRHADPRIADLTSQAELTALIADVSTRARRGELDKVVLARARDLHTPAPVDPLKALSRLAARYPDCYRFLFEPQPGNAFYGATPELMGAVSGRSLTTMGLAGSIPRGSTLEEDETLGTRLLAGEKERREHRLVVEEIRRSLAPLASRLGAAQPGLLKLSNIQHIHTPICASLRPGVDLLAVIAALHPTPAVGGVPQRAAMAYIQQHEPAPRGWYAAPVGWLTPQGEGEFAVALRSAVSVDRHTRLYAGAGILADSDPESEWREIELKFRPMLEAIL